MAGKILLASPRGFCAGVRRALDTVEEVLKRTQPPVYVFHEIVHNNYIVEQLTRRGVIFVESLDEVPDGAVLIFSAHGVSPELEKAAAAKKLKVIDASCPLVKKIHRKARRQKNANCQIILIGHKGHPEIVGTLGQTGGSAKIVETVQDVYNLPKPPAGKKVAYLTQTTLSLDDISGITEALHEKFPDIIGDGDICYATQNRQNAVKELAKQCDLILVIGSKKSSNSNRLREVALKCGVKALLIDGAGDITSTDLENVENIGITAGASAPECLVSETVEFLKNRGWQGPEELVSSEENVSFPLPEI
jgi:4-hydroxy-3-methylbut-2-enyl diphosphate reductase